MTKNKKTFRDILKVFSGNIINIIASVLVGFLLPKILGVDDYGYYKTFTLYPTYASLFTLGITEGIYLVYGGCDYDSIVKEKFRFYTRFFIYSQAIIFTFLSVLLFFLLNGYYRLILIFVCFYSFLTNIITYYQIISQATKRFNELVIVNIIKSSLNLVFILILFFLYHFNILVIRFYIYIILFVFIYISTTIFYLLKYKDITFGKCTRDKSEFKNILKIGVPITISAFMTNFNFSLSRQFVNMFYPNEEYSIYAFSYNMLSLITSATSAISTVIFPILKTSDVNNLEKNFHFFISIILIFVFVSISSYFPFCIFIDWFLPKYVSSINIFKIIFPGIAFTSCLTVVLFNYYKILGFHKIYLIKTVMSSFISIGIFFLLYYFYKTTTSIAIGSVCALSLWYFDCYFYIVKKFNLKWVKDSLYILISLLSFYLVLFISNIYLGFVVYVLLQSLIIYLLYKKELFEFLKLLKSK